jgi:glucose-6-phosphate 1-dehydrogenase
MQTTQLTSYLFHQKDMRMQSSISKKEDFSMTQKHPVWLLKNPLGTILNLLIIYSLWLAGHLREKQVYRIDHYLGKDTVNNILATRFGNILLEPLWNREYIEEVQIFATETIGCEGRSQYYETAGVVRDMLQNHMLQVLALIAMEAPCRNECKRNS